MDTVTFTGELDFPIEITPAAIARLKTIFMKQGKEGEFIRLGVKGGGCSGLEYVLKLDSRRNALDISKMFDGLEIVTDKKSAAFLKGSSLEFTGELIGGGFRFENPNAERGCGCGLSFTPKS